MTGVATTVPDRESTASRGPGPSRRSAVEEVPLLRGTAVAAVLLTVLTAVLGVTTPPRSGPMCRLAVCVTSPYTDVAAYVPRDYGWLYPAVALAVTVLVLLALLAAAAPALRRGIAAAGLAVAVLGATALVLTYAIQLLVVQPSLLAGETGGLSLWTQYNPHGLFIGLENIGYAAFALAFVLVGTAMPRRGAIGVARWALIAGGALTWAALLLLAVVYGAALEYRFELAAISLHWLSVLVAGTALVVELRRHRASAGGEPT